MSATGIQTTPPTAESFVSQEVPQSELHTPLGSHFFVVLSWDASGLRVSGRLPELPLAVPGWGFDSEPCRQLAAKASSNHCDAKLASVAAVGDSAVAVHPALPGVHAASALPSSVPWQLMQPRLPFAFQSIAATHSGAVAAIDTGGELWTAPPPDSAEGGGWASSAARLLAPAPLPTAHGTAGGGARFTQVSAGWHHTVAVDEGGVPWAWGSDAHSQCGAPPHGPQGAPATAAAGGGGSTQQLQALSITSPRRMQLPLGEAGQAIRVAKAAGGAFHTLLLDSEGGVWSCGWGGHGQLGWGAPAQCIATLNKCTADSMATAGKAACRQEHGHSAEGPLLWMLTPPGTTMPGPLQLRSEDLTPIESMQHRMTHIAASGTASAAISEHGELFVWGAHVPCCMPPSLHPHSPHSCEPSSAASDADVMLLPGRNAREGGEGGGDPTPCFVDLAACVPLPMRVPLRSVLAQEQVFPECDSTVHVAAVDVVGTTCGMAVLLRCTQERTNGTAR